MVEEIDEETLERSKPIAMKFVIDNNLIKLKQLFDAGMPIDTPLNPIGQTALMYFCLTLNLESV